MRVMARVLIAMAMAASPVSLPAQLVDTGDGEALIKAVKADDTSAAVALIDAPGSRVVNYRSLNGDTALGLVTMRRDLTWVKYLLGRKADPNIGDRDGNTALMLASRMGFVEAADYMVLVGANVDATNRRGETALIIAVQQRQPKLVRILLEAGANPDKTDHAAGLSARDYAKRDSRSPELLKLIESVQPAKKATVSGPKL